MLLKHIGRRDNTSHIIGANSYSVHKDISFPLKSQEEEFIFFFEKYQNIFTFNAFQESILCFMGNGVVLGAYGIFVMRSEIYG